VLNIYPVNSLSDNYLWVMQRDSHPEVVIVDPGDKRKNLEFLETNNLTPVAILITHQHYDHTGAIEALVNRYPDVKIYCHDTPPSVPPLRIDLPVADRITHPVKDGDHIVIEELGLEFDVTAIPGHTLDHVAYIGEGGVFVGDTIFGCGCGRLFSGTAEQMSASLFKLSQLPAETKMYCAHEYTVDSIGFAKWVEPDNADLKRRDESDTAKQEEGIPTLPSTIGLECATNPFLRFREASVIAAAEKWAGRKLTTDAEVFAALRTWKDREYD